MISIFTWKILVDKTIISCISRPCPLHGSRAGYTRTPKIRDKEILVRDSFTAPDTQDAGTRLFFSKEYLLSGFELIISAYFLRKMKNNNGLFSVSRILYRFLTLFMTALSSAAVRAALICRMRSRSRIGVGILTLKEQYYFTRPVNGNKKGTEGKKKFWLLPLIQLFN